MLGIAVFAIAVLAYTLLSQKITQLNISPPMVFTAIGTVLGIATFQLNLHSEAVLLDAETTLAMILFHDAAHAHPLELWRDRRLLGRLLLVALPLAIALGWVTARWLFPGSGIWLALFLAGALAATDAGLGAPTVLNPVVPVRVRRLLNGESGLNDGLATPVVLFALTAVVADTNKLDIGHAAGEAVIEILIGFAVGVGLGYIGGNLLHIAQVRGWANPTLTPIGVAVMPILAFFGASLIHGNGFIAAFIGGTAYAAVAGREMEADLVTTESILTILGYGVWMLFGAIFVVRLPEVVNWRVVLYSVLSLTLLRFIPVFLSLIKSGLRRKTVWFIAWFGPRGLATVIFALIAYESLTEEQLGTDVLGVMGLTVLFSVVAHGLTAPPWAESYGKWAEEEQPTLEMAG